MNDTIEATDLYAMVFSDDEIKCEGKHRYAPVCSVEVTHLLVGCTRIERVCELTAKDTLERMNRGAGCVGCHRPARQCWKVVAI